MYGSTTQHFFYIMFLLELFVFASCAAAGVASSMSFVYPLGFLDNADSSGKLIATACTSDINSKVNISLQNTTSATSVRSTTCSDYTINATEMFANVAEPFSTVSPPFPGIASGPSLVYGTPFGILVTSDWPIQVYGLNSKYGSVDGFMVFPIVNASTTFFVAGFSYSGTLITAVLSDTLAEIYIVNGTNYTLLDRVELSSSNSNFFRYYRDLSEADPTGLFINSTKPIGLLSGCKCLNVPYGVGYCDHIAEQMPPISQLGTSYIVPPIYGRSDLAGYLVRVVATDIDTFVQWNSPSSTSPVGPTTLTRGQHVEIDVNRTWSPLAVKCTKPCLVMQYNKGAEATGELEDSDPFTMLTTPSSHFDSAATFKVYSINDAPDPQFHFITIVTLSQHLGDILIDGRSIISSANVTRSLVGEYSVVTTTTVPGVHTLNVTSGSLATFAGYLYGHFWHTGYGYSLTYRFSRMTPPTPAITTDAAVTTTRSPTAETTTVLTLPVFTTKQATGNTVPVIVGCVVAGVILLALICAITICVVCRKNVGFEINEPEAHTTGAIYDDTRYISHVDTGNNQYDYVRNRGVVGIQNAAYDDVKEVATYEQLDRATVDQQQDYAQLTTLFESKDTTII